METFGRIFERADFEAWKSTRNAIHPEDQVPEYFLQCTDPDTINNQLSKFIVETRKTNGAQYLPATLHSLLCGILRCMRESNPVGCPNFLDKKDTRFRPLQRTLDYDFNKLHSGSVGRKVKHAETISLEEEDKIWRSGFMDQKVFKMLLSILLESFSVCAEVKNTGVSKSVKYNVATASTYRIYLIKRPGVYFISD